MRILFFLVALSVHSFPENASPSLEWNQLDTMLSVDIQQYENGTRTYYTIYLLKDGIRVGTTYFWYDTETHFGYISHLHIEQEQRSKSYGSILLRFALDMLAEQNAHEIGWIASPFCLRAGEKVEAMLPKLIAFYQRHGATMLSTDGNTAQMRYYPKLA